MLDFLSIALQLRGLISHTFVNIDKINDEYIFNMTSLSDLANLPTAVEAGKNLIRTS